MRDTSVSDEDLAIQAAKENLQSLAKRPGYLEAMRKEPPANVARIGMLVAAAVCGGILYACKLYVTAAWLMWFLMVMFGALGLGFLLAMIGFSASAAAKPWPAAIIEKKLVDEKHRILFLRENGERHELTVTEAMYGLLRAGDVGVVKCSGSAPDYTVDSFQRL